MNYIFFEVALKALMNTFVENMYIEGNFNPSVAKFVVFCVSNANSHLNALFQCLYYFMMPSKYS